MLISLIGLPASGKGFVLSVISKYLDIPSISIGDLIREKTGNMPITEWNPLPDEEAVYIFITKIYKKHKSVIVDGVPRSLKQLLLLEDVGISFNLFIYLNVDEHIAKQRFLKRNRNDSTEEIWETRLALDRQRIPELINYIKDNNYNLETIDNMDNKQVLINCIHDVVNKYAFVK